MKTSFPACAIRVAHNPQQVEFRFISFYNAVPISGENVQDACVTTMRPHSLKRRSHDSKQAVQQAHLLEVIGYRLFTVGAVCLTTPHKSSLIVALSAAKIQC